MLLPKALAARHRAHRRGYMQAQEYRMMGEGLDIMGRRKDGSDLRPGILVDFGLAAAIDCQLQEFCTRAGLEFDYQADLRGE
jgi:signal transduction histidine kinase